MVVGGVRGGVCFPLNVDVPTVLFLGCVPCGLFCLFGFLPSDYFHIPDISVFGACLWVVNCEASTMSSYNGVFSGVPWGFCGCFLLCYEDCVSQICIFFLGVVTLVVVFFVFCFCLQDAFLDVCLLLCWR